MSLIPLGYVLTGGPSCGKTTTLHELQKLGFATVGEAARTIIDEALLNGIPVEVLREDQLKFQQIVTQRCLLMENAAPRDKIVFFDRSLVDNIAYSRLFGVDPKFIEMIAHDRYRKIFFLEQLAYEKDYARVEDIETVKKLNELIPQVYKEFGYEVITVPIGAIEQRVKFILDHIESEGIEPIIK